MKHLLFKVPQRTCDVRVNFEGIYRWLALSHWLWCCCPGFDLSDIRYGCDEHTRRRSQEEQMKEFLRAVLRDQLTVATRTPFNEKAKTDYQMGTQLKTQGTGKSVWVGIKQWNSGEVERAKSQEFINYDTCALVFTRHRSKIIIVSKTNQAGEPKRVPTGNSRQESPCHDAAANFNCAPTAT